jgi:2-polyprenyl-6-methoxyphenol hydroxylase-like FAD-dependent oxidoreductase
MAGQAFMERLLPGFCDELERQGGSAGRVASETMVFELGRRMPMRDLDMRIISAPRPLIDRVALQLLEARNPVRILRGTRVTGLRLDDGNRLVGLAVTSGGEECFLRSDLVIDCSGAGTAVSEWLAAHGIGPVPVTTSQCRQWYASLVVRRPFSHFGDSCFRMVFAIPPRTRVGMLSPSGREDWHITVTGQDGDPAPTNWAEFLAFSRSLEDQMIADVITGAQPLGPVRMYRKPIALWRRYEQMGYLPPGLLVAGEALANLNPLFGQGISLAAWQAVLLRDLAVEHGGRFGAAASRAYFAAASESVQMAWQLGTSVTSDMEMQDLWGDAEDEQLANRVCAEPEFHRAYVEGWHLLRPMAPVLARGATTPLQKTS